MILLYPQRGEWHVPFTIRPETMAAHAGQISFPGGMVEPGESTRDAALRELHEELGVEPTTVEVLGSLSPTYVFVSNFLVTPWMAVSRKPLVFNPCSQEVAGVIEAPLSHLADLANAGEHRYERGELTFSAPHFAWEEHRIWARPALSWPSWPHCWKSFPPAGRRSLVTDHHRPTKYPRPSHLPFGSIAAI